MSPAVPVGPLAPGAMLGAVRSWLDVMSAGFLANDFDAVVQFFSPCLPVYLEGDPVALIGRGQQTEAFGRLRAELLAEGLTAMRYQIAAIGLPRQGQFPVMVNWHYDLGPGRPARTSAMTYYCQSRLRTADNPLPLRIEMVEYRQAAFVIQASAAAMLMSGPTALPRQIG